MSRPVKWRKVEFVPGDTYFIPFGKPKCQLAENILKVEELEAIRLKDIENLDQDQCAKKMEISRQTFQRILNEARSKIADALVKGKAIRIEGGNFTQNICQIRCLSCGNQWEESYENLSHDSLVCPKCNAQQIICLEQEDKSFCGRRCCKKFF